MNRFKLFFLKIFEKTKSDWENYQKELKQQKEQAEQEKRVAQEIETLRGFGQSSSQSHDIKIWSDEEWDNLTTKARSQAGSLGSKNYVRPTSSSTKYDDDDDYDDDYIDDYDYDDYDDLARYDDLVPEFDIIYQNAVGEISHREIAVIYVNERYVVAYCFQACEKRTFRLDRFISVVELSSGQSYSTRREIKKVCSSYVKDDL